MRFKKFFLISSLLAIFSVQSVVPAMADSSNWSRERHRDRGDDDRRHYKHRDHDRRGYHGHDRRDHRQYYKHHRDHRRHYDSRVNLGIYLGGPVYQPRRSVYPEPYYGRPSYNGNLIGTVLGGGLGGLAGSQIGKGDGRTAAIIGGTLIGAIFGSNIGMRPYDYGYAANVFEGAPSRQTVAWHNPDDGIAYQLTPTRTYQGDGGQYCREYQARAVIGNRNADTYGTACRMPDGAWQIMN